MVADFKLRNGVAIEYSEDEGNKVSVTYPELAEAIEREAANSLAECRTVEVIRAETTYETVVEIIANVIAGCYVMIADPLVPDASIEMASRAAAGLREERMLRRDSRGRMITEKSEGELLFFTSGTTSSSKIVRLTSASLCASACSGQSMLPCGEGDRLLCILPLSHVFGLVCGVLWGLAYGATVSLGRGVRHMIDDALFFCPTIIPAVPSIVSAMIKYDMINPELKTVLIGAAPCGPETIEALHERGISVYLGYGLTETSSGIAITQDQDDPFALYPCPGADIGIEPDGEITVATPCMMQGYIGSIPMFRGDRFFTGDIGSIDEKGRLHLKGRKKDAIVMKDGNKIFCPEYEEDLAEMTGTDELAVIAKNDRAVLIAGPGSDTEVIRKAVAEYNKSKLRSQQIYDVISADSELPRTATGKLKRYEIQEKYSK